MGERVRLELRFGTTLGPEQVLASLVDFSASRLETWPTIDSAKYRLHDQGQGWAEATEGSAYSGDFSLHRHICSAIDAMQASAAMRSMLGESFVTLYCALKDAEYKEFQEIITPWEREILMLNV